MAYRIGIGWDSLWDQTESPRLHVKVSDMRSRRPDLILQSKDCDSRFEAAGSAK